MQIREMTIDDYSQLIELFRATPGIVVRESDSLEATARYLQRNPGLSVVAEENGVIAGCLMAGHDGRRGVLRQLVVRQDCRRHGIGAALIEACLQRLSAEGIGKSQVFVLADNELGRVFFQRHGWTLRSDIELYSREHRPKVNI